MMRQGFAIAGMTVAILCLPGWSARSWAAEVFVRCRVIEPAGERFVITTGGFRHGVHGKSGPEASWYLPSRKIEAAAGQWTPWIDLTDWPLHKRYDRSGGVAEWPAMKLAIAPADARGKALAPGKGGKGGCELEVQLADRAEESAVVISFREKSESNTIGFLMPHPLREKKGEFETGSQMAARHRAWAEQAVKAAGGAGGADSAEAGRGIQLKKFGVCTSIWGHYDPGLARQEVESLKLLGFNVVGGVGAEILREAGVKTYGHTWHYLPDPEISAAQWKKYADGSLAKQLATEDGRWMYANMHHFTISDEIQTLNFKGVDAAKLNGWFRSYLREKGVTEADLGRAVDKAEYPVEALMAKTLDRSAPLATRKLLYHAAKFGQWCSARQLRQTSDLVRQSIPGVPIETLPTDHGFFNAWGPPHMGMSYRLLDLFELGAQETVDYLDGEDWLGLNHMYGPSYTWTGAQTFEYFNAILRSGMRPGRMSLMSLITPSDEGYLRLKAYSALAQGAKRFFFWTFGPTYIGTENYWSDLRSEYDGIAKLTSALAKSEQVLHDAQPVRDPVAVLYSVSHDFWHTDDPASFVENRLTWHALRHAGIQPDFLREEDVESGRLKDYRVLYITGQCVTRKASEAIDRWVLDGGIAYLSAGAATRDEFFEPYVPGFASAAWRDNPAGRMIRERHDYNEREDVPKIKPITMAVWQWAGGKVEIPVIGCRLTLREDLPAAARTAEFADDGVAAANIQHGAGRVIAAGFMPGLAYSPFKVNQTTLDEKWPAGPREFLRLPLEAAKIRPVAAADVPVVEASLLKGSQGMALVLVNYTYQPIERLRVRLESPGPIGSAVSTEGSQVSIEKDGSGVTLQMPLKWTDIVILRP